MSYAFSFSKRALDTYSVGGWVDKTAAVDTVDKGKAFTPTKNQGFLNQSAGLWPSKYADWAIINSREIPF